MSLPDIFGLVPRQWQQHPSLISPRATPAANPIEASTATIQADNFVIRPRAEPTTTSPWIGATSTVPTIGPLSSRDPTTTPSSAWLTSRTSPTDPVLPHSSTLSPRSSFAGTTDWSSPTTPPTPPPTTTVTRPTILSPLPTFDPSKDGKGGSSSNGVIIGTVVAFVLLTALGIWRFHRQSGKGRGLLGSKKWVDNEKGLYQAHHQPGYSDSPSPTHSYYGGNGYGHSDAYYYQYGNNLHNSNSISRGPQNNHPEMEEEEDNVRSGKIRPQTLPNDTAVYWPPPPGLSPQGLSSSSPPPPPFAPLAKSPSAAAEAAAASTSLKRSLTRNPQDHRRQEQLEHLLMLQRRQIRELQELQQQHQRENPLSSVSAPHAPTQQDRQIWQQSDQEQRQQWLQQQQPHQPRGGRNNSGGIIVSGPVGVVRDPQDWGIYDDAGRGDGGGGGSSGSNGGGGHSRRVMQERKRDSGDSNEDEGGEPGEDGQQSLRQYIAQMKADYEEQFRKHQEELERLKAEQQTQLQMLREQIKE